MFSLQYARETLLHHRRPISLLLFIGILASSIHWIGLDQDFRVSYLQALLNAHPISGLVVFALLFTLGNLVHFPGIVFLISAVLVLGKVEGAVATYLAANVACAISFLVIRLLGGNALHRLDHKLINRALKYFHQRPIASVFVLRTVFQTLPMLNLTLAVSGIGFRDYLLGTLLGLPIPIALISAFFEYLIQSVTG